MKKQVLAVIIVVLIIAGFFYFNNVNNSDKSLYSLKGNTFSYSSERGKVDYHRVLIEENKTFNVYKVDFDTRQLLDEGKASSLSDDNEDIRIYGLLFMPKQKTDEKFASVIFLPGGQGTKESRRETAETIADFGYAVLVIDQRGIGETGGKFLDFQEDYKIFANKLEPTQHLAVYDVLRSFDFLREQKEIDENNIVVVGESMGARYGIIATALDNRIKGVIGISTSGFHIDINPLTQGNDYMVSVDADNYIKKISPRKLFMIHCKEDNVVLLSDAEKTFAIAKEPKTLKVFDNCIHGYNPVMKGELRRELKKMLE